MWPPPAPPEYVDHIQLPANLRPSSLAAEHRRCTDDTTDDIDDNANVSAARTQVITVICSHSEKLQIRYKTFVEMSLTQVVL